MADEQIIEMLENKVLTLTEQANEVRLELLEVTTELKRYERALFAFKPPVELPKTKTGGVKPQKRPGVGPETLEIVKRGIFEVAKTKDEFRQVDVRDATGITSGVAAIAFENLRQEGMIRFSRRSGNNKYFRLTEQTING